MVAVAMANPNGDNAGWDVYKRQALDRIGDEIEKSDKEKIKQIVANNEIYKNENQHMIKLDVYKRQLLHWPYQYLWKRR